jgi:deazaflavin-dependent oxidoreductase (nitroreductase family)
MNPPNLRIPNRIVGRLVELGLPIGPMAVLTVPGRKTGLPRSAPVAISRLDDGWRLVAAYGVVDWVKNLRLAGGGRLTYRGKTFDVIARELPADEAGPILRESVATAGPVTRRMVAPYFDAALDAGPGEWEQESRRHPVFILTTVGATGISLNGI